MIGEGGGDEEAFVGLEDFGRVDEARAGEIMGGFVGEVELVAGFLECSVEVVEGRPVAAGVAGKPGSVGGPDDVDAAGGHLGEGSGREGSLSREFFLV